MKTLRKELRAIAKQYKVQLQFYSARGIPYAWPRKSEIYIYTGGYSRNSVLSSFFHELGHIIDYRNGLFPGYYVHYPTKAYLRRYAIKAEIHTDKTGKGLMKSYYPHDHFIETYRYKSWQKWLLEYWEIA